MPKNIYFYLLILCGIWSYGIIVTFADEETKESSDFSIRHKRVVSRVPGEDARAVVTTVKYVVIIRNPVNVNCGGSILSLHVVITAASCVTLSPNTYQVVSGTSTSNRGRFHNVVDIRRHLGIALVIIDQDFKFGAFSRNIQLHVAPLLPGLVGQVSGWGFNSVRGAVRGTDYPEQLRSIEVPIMSHRDCVNRYRPRIAISDKEVCTYHPQRHTGHSDIGAGLVVDGYLAGVLLWSGLDQHGINAQYPDVFAVLQHSDYNQWIRSNVREIDPSFSL